MQARHHQGEEPGAHGGMAFQGPSCQEQQGLAVGRSAANASQNRPQEPQQACTKHPRMRHADSGSSLQHPCCNTTMQKVCARLAKNLFDRTHPQAIQLRLQLVLAEERASKTTQDTMNQVKQTAPQSHHNHTRQEERTRKELPVTDAVYGAWHAACDTAAVCTLCFKHMKKVSHMQHFVKLPTALLRKVVTLASSQCCRACRHIA